MYLFSQSIYRVVQKSGTPVLLGKYVNKSVILLSAKSRTYYDAYSAIMVSFLPVHRYAVYYRQKDPIIQGGLKNGTPVLFLR